MYINIHANVTGGGTGTTLNVQGSVAAGAGIAFYLTTFWVSINTWVSAFHSEAIASAKSTSMGAGGGETGWNRTNSHFVSGAGDNVQTFIDYLEQEGYSINRDANDWNNGSPSKHGIHINDVYNVIKRFGYTDQNTQEGEVSIPLNAIDDLVAKRAAKANLTYGIRKSAAVASKQGPSKLDDFQTLLDGIGLLPGLGEPADLLNGLIYSWRGDETNAYLSYAAAMPFVGWLAAGTKFSNKLKKYHKAASKVHGTAATFNKTTAHDALMVFDDMTAGFPRQIINTPKGDIIKVDLGGGKYMQKRLFDSSGAHTTFDFIDNGHVFEFKFFAN